MELLLNEAGSLNTSDTYKAKVFSAFFTSVCTKRVIQAFMIRESAQRAMNSGSGSCQGLYERPQPTLVLGAMGLYRLCLRMLANVMIRRLCIISERSQIPGEVPNE